MPLTSGQYFAIDDVSIIQFANDLVDSEILGIEKDAYSPVVAIWNENREYLNITFIAGATFRGLNMFNVPCGNHGELMFTISKTPEVGGFVVELWNPTGSVIDRLPTSDELANFIEVR